jgi:hypothetical protein
LPYQIIRHTFLIHPTYTSFGIAPVKTLKDIFRRLLNCSNSLGNYHIARARADQPRHNQKAARQYIEALPQMLNAHKRLGDK